MSSNVQNTMTKRLKKKKGGRRRGVKKENARSDNGQSSRHRYSPNETVLLIVGLPMPDQTAGGEC